MLNPSFSVHPNIRQITILPKENYALDSEMENRKWKFQPLEKLNRQSIEIFPWFLDHLPSTCCFWYPKLATVCLRHVWGSFYTHCTPFFASFLASRRQHWRKPTATLLCCLLKKRTQLKRTSHAFVFVRTWIDAKPVYALDFISRPTL